MVIHSKPDHLHGCVIFPSNISCLGVGTEVGGFWLGFCQVGCLPVKLADTVTLAGEVGFWDNVWLGKDENSKPKEQA